MIERLRQGLSCLAIAAFALTLVPAARAADAGAPPVDASTTTADPRRAAVVARVGARAVTVGELEDRMAAIPRFQLADFAPDAAQARRKFLETVVLPELLLEAAAAKRNVAGSPAFAPRVARARANAAMRAVRKGLPAPEAISPEEVKAYYEEHRAQYDVPERVAVWRILVATREEAQSVIDAAKKDLTVTTFTALARDKSLDKATNLRAGNLGFLNEEGISNEAGLRVEPSVVRAAKTVKDGELVPAPVAEAANFAVVWRRGTVKATKQSLAEVEESIRTIVSRRKGDDATMRLVDELKKSRVTGLDTEVLRTTELPSYLDVKPIKQ